MRSKLPKPGKMASKKSKKNINATSNTTGAVIFTKKKIQRMSAKISSAGAAESTTTTTTTTATASNTTATTNTTAVVSSGNATTNTTISSSNASATTTTSSSNATTAIATTNGQTTPARRLRTRNSTGSGNASGSESAKKRETPSTIVTTTPASAAAADSHHHQHHHDEKPEKPIQCVSIPMNHASSSVSASKKYHNSCPHPTPMHKKSAHTQPHSSNTFDMNKNEEFHFDTPMECPVFRPTVDEFKNPLAYISKIRSIAEKCGIAKIQPPDSWSPPFAVDVDKLHFVPRVQRLNELEAKTRVKLNFLDQIAKFWELQGSSLKIPMVERKALDLYTLHRVVQEEGGMEQTTKERKWAKVANRMQYPPSKSVGATLKAHYERILHPFEVYTSGKVLGAANIAAAAAAPSSTAAASATTTTAAAAASTAGTPIKIEDGGGTAYKVHEIPTRQQITPPNESSARRSKRFANSSANCGLSGKAPGAATGTGAVTIKTETKEDFKRDLLSSFNAINAAGGVSVGGSGAGNSGAATRGAAAAAAAAAAHNSSGGGGGVGSSSGATGGGGSAQKKTPDPQQLIDPLMKYICHICNRGDVEESMLLCDGCDDSYHTFCLLPPLSSIPKGEWLCPRCVVEEVSKPQEAFGFEQAEREYTLQQFGQMADQFKQDYFCKPVHMVPTDLVEREFWRIVSSIDEDVTVEYGADLHTMDHGSGFPTKSSLYLLPGDQEYAESSWNLNNLPLLEDSILGHINADISGMNAPWMYVGMCFAAFCWHNEDHWSYSINYLHWGEPKTWYGVPGSCAEQLEETMKQAAPELFASQPDLLHQLVTIMNPNILMNNGVPVYRTDQNAGEFVITFPRAYHAGFNQGYNFAEAVNFAPADWLKMGRECVNHYSMLRRFCVFSHDELVCKMALEPAKLTFGIATACYIDMAEMVDTEKKLRKSLLEWGVTRAERKAFELVPDDERHCQECNTTCFLSAVACECTKDIVCLRHYTVLCNCAPEKHTLLYRYTLDEMPLMLQKLKVKAHNFERWLSRCRDIVDATTPTTVTLAELQDLCKEAEIKKFPSSLLIDRLNAAAIEAEKCVTVIQQLGINKVRTRSDHSQETAQYKLTMEELELFVQEIDNLCCIIDEGTSVRELLVLGKQFVERAEQLLKLSIEALEENDLDTLINEGNSLRIELLQLDMLNKRLKQCKWYKRSQGLRETSAKLTYNDIKQLLHVAAAELEPADPFLDREVRKLQQIGAAIEAWETQAAKYFRCLTQQHELAEIEQFLKTAKDINGLVPSYTLLKDALRKAKDWLRSVEQLQKHNHFPYCHTLEAMIERGKNIPIQLEELSRMQGHLSSAHKWRDNTARAFLRKSTFYTLLEVLMPRAEPINIDSDLKKPFADDFLKEKNPAEIVDSFKHAEEQELRDMRELRRENMAKNPLRDVYCLCRAEFRGVMFNCQLCRDWFHEDCVPPPTMTSSSAYYQLANNNNNNGAINGSSGGGGGGIVGAIIQPLLTLPPTKPKWLCPSCVRSKRPRLETILPLLVQLQQLPIRLPEDEALRCLAERAMNWQDRARKALTSPDVTAALEAIHAAQQELRRDKALGNISSPRKPRRSSTRSNNNNNNNSSSNKDTLNNTSGNNNNNNNNSLHTASTNANTAPSDTDDDDEIGRLRIDEDGFSGADEDFDNGNNQPRAGSVNAPTTTTETSMEPEPSVSPLDLLKLLSESEIDNLMELMMEGDLLEVSLDETHELWRILETVPPTSVQAEAVRRVAQYYHQQQQQQAAQQQQTASTSSVNSAAEDSNDSLIVQSSSPNSNSGVVVGSGAGGGGAAGGVGISGVAGSGTGTGAGATRNKKRRSLDPASGCPVPRKKNATPKPTSAKKSTRKSDTNKQQQQQQQQQQLQQQQADDAENKQANGGNTSNNATGNSNNNNNSNNGNSGSVQKKRKRTTTNASAANNTSASGGGGGAGAGGAQPNNNANSGGNGGNTGGTVVNTGTGGQKKHAQRAQQAAQEDDEEECRAENCHKPTGREVDWVQCDGGCNEWFHMYCVGLNRSQIKADDDYICIRCSKTVTVAAIAGGSSVGVGMSITATSTSASVLTTTTAAAAAAAAAVTSVVAAAVSSGKTSARTQSTR